MKFAGGMMVDHHPAKFIELLQRYHFAAHGFAAHGLAAHGLLAAQGFAAHGLHGFTTFFAAHGLAVHGLQGEQLATSAVGDGSGAAIAIGAVMARVVPIATAGISAFCVKVMDFLVIYASLNVR